MDKQYCNPEIWGGIECTINRVRNEYFDQLDYSGHYKRPGDIEKIAELGITKLRYPLLWEKHQPNLDAEIDWTWSENQLSKIRAANVDVIAGLVHHGSGPGFTRLDDPEFPTLLANYARLVAEKFPWINYYTPVNEPLTTARFSGLYGIWFPHHNNARSFLKMLLNELKGTVLAMQEIRKINPAARLVQTEDLGKTYSIPSLAYQARFENQRRWLTFDILCGRFNEQHPLWKYCNQFSIPREDFQFFLDNPCIPDIFGFNHYLTSERYLDTNLQAYPLHTHGGNGRDHYADVEAVRVELEEPMGLEVLLQEAWERYKQPMAITEVHLHSHREEQLRWFRQVWDTAKKLGSENINLQAVTSWALLGSYGWNNLLREPAGDYEPGAFDLRGGDLRPTALAHFIKETAKTNLCTHPLSHEQGWWRRSSRLIYQPSMAQVRIRPGNNQPILIIGRNGTLGKAFAKICEERFLDYRLLGRGECDISSFQSIEEAIDRHRPWAVINAAGFVRVDDAEREKEACFRDNTFGPQLLAKACQKKGIRLLSFSSDLVFDGQKSGAYVESDPVNPLNVYGSSKAEAEDLVRHACPSALMVRTSAFFGPWDEYNFLSYVRKSLSLYQPINVASNILVSPTYVPDLVHASLDLLIDEVEGIWHMANKGQISWSELAHEVASNFDLDRGLIQSLTNEEMNYPARRPDNSVLSSQRGQLLPTLEEALAQYFNGQKRTQRKVA